MTFFNWIKDVLLPFGGWTVVTIALSGFMGKFVVDRTLEGRKAQLGQETERLKSELTGQLERQKLELTGELERQKAILAREADTYRLRLKKQELLYEKEVSAAREFMRIHRQIRPTHSHPELGWYEACIEVAQQFERVERTLNEFLIAHGAALDRQAREDIATCHQIASAHKFDAHEHEQGLDTARRKAEEVLESLVKIEGHIVDRLRD